MYLSHEWKTISPTVVGHSTLIKKSVQPGHSPGSQVGGIGPIANIRGIFLRQPDHGVQLFHECWKSA